MTKQELMQWKQEMDEIIEESNKEREQYLFAREWNDTISTEMERLGKEFNAIPDNGDYLVLNAEYQNKCGIMNDLIVWSKNPLPTMTKAEFDEKLAELKKQLAKITMVRQNVENIENAKEEKKMKTSEVEKFSKLVRRLSDIEDEMIGGGLGIVQFSDWEREEIGDDCIDILIGYGYSANFGIAEENKNILFFRRNEN